MLERNSDVFGGTKTVGKNTLSIALYAEVLHHRLLRSNTLKTTPSVDRSLFAGLLTVSHDAMRFHALKADCLFKTFFFLINVKAYDVPH